MPNQQVVALGAATRLVTSGQRGSFTVEHGNPDGSRVVVYARPLPSGGRTVIAYRLTHDVHAGTQTQIYADGRRIVTGRDFVTTTAPGRPSVTVHANGLREAKLPDGRPLFREITTTIPGRDGQPREVIQRTVFAGGPPTAPVVYAKPAVQVYDLVPYHGLKLASYRPLAFAEAVLNEFVAPLANPVQFGCQFCPSPVAQFDQPIDSYTAPADLLGDLQISTGLSDGFVEQQSAGADGDAELAALNRQVAELQQQIDAAAAQNAELGSQLGAGLPPAGGQTGDGGTAIKRVRIPEPVRQQIRKQVKQSIALHKSEQPLTVPDVVASDDAQSFIFQVGPQISASDVASGESCVLTSGDLISFAAIPGPDDAVARMTVATSKNGSCKAGAVLELALTDVQEMLNSFNQRLEANMKAVGDQIASAAAKSG
ncbi:MAG: hypothetical protein JO047_13375 [Alphaproteobacteria bacterium]|nr:hypothetical protein [Alphaproteobacteria bacterium]